jgi:uncharacterized protein YjbJ (UPF0337 family)
MKQPETRASDEQVVVRPGETRVVGAGHPYAPVPERWQGQTEPTDRETERLQGEIGATRAEMSQTIDAIQEKLSPDHVGEQVQRVAEQVKTQVRESVQEIAGEARDAIRGATIGRVENMIADARDTAFEVKDGFLDRVRENPVPAAIAGLGLAWLLMSDSGRSRHRMARRDRRDSRYYYRPEERHDHAGYEARYVERYPAGSGRREDMVDQARETVGGVAEQARETVGEVAGQAREVVGDAAERARAQAEQLAGGAQELIGDAAEEAERRARMARYRFDDALGSSPLALGAIAIGLGAAIGLAVPSTERENELLGETRDRLMARARDVVGEAAEDVREQAGEVLGKSNAGASGQAGARSPVRTGV